MNAIRGIDSEQQARAEKRDQRRRLQLIVWVFDKQTYLLGGLSAAAFNGTGTAIAKICRIELANPVVTEPGAFFDSACPGLVPNHSKGEFELTSFGRVAVVSEAHLFLFLLVNAHIQWYKSLYHLYMVNQSKIA